MDSTEFSMTASQKRSLKKKEKKRRKLAAKGKPATQSTKATSPDGVAEENSNDSDAESNQEATPTDQELNSSIAEDIIAAAAVTGVRSRSNDDNDSQMSESSQASNYLPDGKLRWAYAQLERYLDRKEEPPAWLLRMVMQDVDNTEQQFQRVSDFQQTEINSELEVDQLPTHSAHSSHQPSADSPTQSAAATSATNHLSTADHPLPDDHSLPAAHATGTNAENRLSNGSQFSSQHDTRYENARNLASEFSMSRTESNPTPRNESSTPTPRERTNTTRVNPSSSNNTTSGTQLQASATTAETTTVPARNPIHFVMKQSDLPKDLILTGAQTEDVVETLTIFRARVRLNSTDGSSDAIVEQRAIKYLPLLVRDAAADSLQQLLSGSLEWRSEAQLATLRANGSDMTVRAPQSWSDYVSAFTTLFAPANRMSLLAREFATLKQDPKQSVDTYALKVTKARSRLMAEARRLAPAGMTPFEHAWSVFTTASFENGLLPHLRLELIREDPAVSFQESRARAKKHEANNLRGVKPSPDPIPNPTPTAAQTSALSTPQYDQKMALMETTIASLSSSMENLKRGRTNASTLRERSSTPARRQQKKTQRNSSNNNNRNSSNNSNINANNDASTAVVVDTCNYPKCKYPDSHTRENCGLRKAHIRHGYEKYAR